MIQQIESLQKNCIFQFKINDSVIETIQQQYEIPNGDYNAVYKMHYKISQLLEGKKEAVPADEAEWKFRSLRVRSPKRQNDVIRAPISPEKTPYPSPTKGEMAAEEKSLTVPGKNARKKAELQVYLKVDPASPASPSSSSGSGSVTHPTQTSDAGHSEKSKPKKKGFYNFLKPLRRSASKETLTVPEEAPFLKKRVNSSDALRLLDPSPTKSANAIKRHSALISLSKKEDLDNNFSPAMEILSPQSPKLLLQGKLLKKEEFDEAGFPMKCDWEQIHAILDRSQLTFEKIDDESPKRSLNLKTRIMAPLTKSVSDITIMKEKSPKIKHKSAIIQTAAMDDTPPMPEEPKFRLSVALSNQRKQQQRTTMLFRRLKSLNNTNMDVEIQGGPGKLSSMHAQSTDNLFIPEDAAVNTPLITNLIPSKLETLFLNNLCRVTIVSLAKKDYIIRVMLGTQRSFLLRANSPNEMELWMQAMKVSISMVNSTY